MPDAIRRRRRCSEFISVGLISERQVMLSAPSEA